jgi:integrase
MKNKKLANILYILVQRLLGHADLQMATRYVQDVSEQTDSVIQNSRMYVCKINR